MRVSDFINYARDLGEVVEQYGLEAVTDSSGNLLADEDLHADDVHQGSAKTRCSVPEDNALRTSRVAPSERVSRFPKTDCAAPRAKKRIPVP